MGRTEWSALLLLRSTIGPDAQSAITGINSLCEAYLKLLSVYGKVCQNVILQYSKWASVRFIQSMTAQSFVSKFQMTLQELQTVVSSLIQPLVKFLQFIEGIRGSPGVYRFLVTVTVDGYEENMMNNASDQMVEETSQFNARISVAKTFHSVSIPFPIVCA